MQALICAPAETMCSLGTVASGIRMESGWRIGALSLLIDEAFVQHSGSFRLLAVLPSVCESLGALIPLALANARFTSLSQYSIPLIVLGNMYSDFILSYLKYILGCIPILKGSCHPTSINTHPLSANTAGKTEQSHAFSGLLVEAPLGVLRTGPKKEEQLKMPRSSSSQSNLPHKHHHCTIHSTHKQASSYEHVGQALRRRDLVADGGVSD